MSARTTIRGALVKLFSYIHRFGCQCVQKSSAWTVHQFWTITIWTRTFLMDVDDYTQLVDGFKNIVDMRRHTYERIFWFLLTVGFIYGAVFACLVQWNRYVAHPTVISLERDYRSWNATLPGMTLCYTGRANATKSEQYIQRQWNVSADDEEYEYFRRFVEIVANATVGGMISIDLNDYEEDERLENVNFRELVHEVHPDATHVVSSFDRDFVIDQQMAITELGLCYVINAPITVLLKIATQEITAIGKPLTCSYLKNQCFLKVDILDTAAMIAVHSPYEVPVFDDQRFSVKKADETIGIYKIVEVVAGNAVRNLNIKQRRCIFEQEMIGQRAIITGNMCTVKCRAETAVELCDCKPHFYTFFDGDVCTLSGLICLQRSFWPMQAVRVCDCTKSCTELNYLENNFYRRVWSVGETNFMHKSSFRAEVLPQKVRMKRDVVYSFEDFLVSFGGAAALFVGCSVWKFTRLGYLLLLKLLEALERLWLRVRWTRYEFVH